MVQTVSVKKTKILIIAGATASGKTSLSIKLAKMLNGEVINADSMQIYKYFNVGTAKVNTEEMDGVTHHLLDFLELNQEFSTSLYKQLATKKIEEITSRGKLPILVGGTGLFIESVLYPFEFSLANKNDEIRKKYASILEKNGNEYLYNLLKEKCPKRASEINCNDVKRVIRALEIIEQGGNFEKQVRESDYNYVYLCIDSNREELYNRINKRVDLMMQQGLLEEVKTLIAKGADWSSQAMQAIGYKEWKDYFDGILTKDEVIEKIKLNTRHYAKRQLTWFRHRKDVIWVDIHKDINDILLLIKGKLNI